ncbi:MAG: hybrid sensor histidine kinase/response regulator, partial [Acidobacteria bacterium]|nr:hybrid sensor histidine kinase/response regulator [Acidobacteriota bacterium]
MLSNAIKFTPPDGQVSIHLERADPHARITIRDNGNGIEAAFLPYIFDRFAQQPGTAATTKRRSGLGLGLALARQLVELHGGSIEAASEGPGRGSTFTLDFPLRAIAPAPQAPTTTERRTAITTVAVSLADVRVLVVDDEGDARALVATVLKQAGARVTQADSADEGLARFEGEKPFDVIVSDIGMPGKDGYS